MTRPKRDPRQCSRCGAPHAKCTAHRRDGKPCGQKPMAGQRVCRMHGGSSPKALAAAEQRLADEVAQKALARALDNPDAPPVTDPIPALQRLAGRLLHAVDAMGLRVNELERLRSVSDIGTEQIRAEVVMWNQVLDKAAGVLTNLAKLGIDERTVRVEERELELLNLAWAATVADPELGLSTAQRKAAPGVLARHLRVVQGGAT